MKRFDYRITVSRRLIGIELPAALPTRYRRSLPVLAGSIAVVAVACAVQGVRLNAADRQANEYALRVEAADREVVRIRSLAADVTRSRALVARVDDIRRSGPARASQLAALGNSLPADAWFTAIRIDRNTVAVEGRGTRLASVGATLAALARAPSYGGARLIGIRNVPPGAGVTYAIALEAAP